MTYPYPEGRRVSRLGGIILMAAMVVLIGMLILVSFVTLGAIFSAMDKMTYMLSATPYAVYNSLRNTVSSTFAILATLIMITSVGALIAAIFMMNKPGGGDFET